MKKKYPIYFLLIVVASLNGCFNKEKRKYKKTYYASGKLENAGWYLHDTLLVDTMYWYYENGNVSAIDIRNDSGILNGIGKMYYENGNLMQVANYINGFQERWVYKYTKEGFLDTRGFCLHDKAAGDIFGYDKNGNINYYGFYDFNEENRNLIEWDSTEKIIKDYRYVQWVDSTDRIIDTLQIRLLISNPPKCRTVVKLDYLSAKGFLIKSDIVTGVPYRFIKELVSDSLKTVKISSAQYDSATKKISYHSGKLNIE